MNGKLFELVRTHDHSGVSGTGVVAEGIEWPNGQVALHWLGDHPATSVWTDIREVEAVHGHGGDTTVRYGGEDPDLTDQFARLLSAIVTLPGKPYAVQPDFDNPAMVRVAFLDRSTWQAFVGYFGGSIAGIEPELVDGELRWLWTGDNLSLMCFQPTEWYPEVTK